MSTAMLSRLDTAGALFHWKAAATGVCTAAGVIEAQHAYQENVARVFPGLAELSTVEAIQGVPVYTVDGGLCVGAVPDVDGLWALAGDRSGSIR